MASPTDVSDLSQVASLSTVLESFVERFPASRPVTSVELRPIQQSLTRLIFFCTDSHEKDPLIREGNPIRPHQKLLRERNVLDLAVELLRVPFQRGIYSCDATLLDPDNQSLHHMMCLTYRLLKQACKSYRKNRQYVGQYISIFLEQLGLQV